MQGKKYLRYGLSSLHAGPLRQHAFHILFAGEVPTLGFCYAPLDFLDLLVVQGNIVLERLGLGKRATFALHAVAPKRTETSLETPGSCMVTP